jgi:nicotinamidase/pyrazinamidase
MLMYDLESCALIIVDLQVDFCPGGALAVNDGDEIVDGINNLITKKSSQFNKIILTADWHPKGHVSFSSTHNASPFTGKKIGGVDLILWPDHCIEGTLGASFHSNLRNERADMIIRKGRTPGLDSYSAFFENDRKTPTGLEGYLKNFGINKVLICGLAFDWCVFFSAMDSVKHGFETSVIIDLTRSIDLPAGYAREKENEMERAGVIIVESSQFKEM